MSRRRVVRVTLLLIALCVSACAACRPAVLTQQVEARRIAADLHLQFTKAADAANRAVMADADEDSATAAREAQDATQAVERDLKELRPLLESLEYRNELRFLATFEDQFAEFRKLDEEILPLAVENSNLKAQRLSFGPAREAAEAFGKSLRAAAQSAETDDRWRADALAANGAAAVLEIQVLQAPHIAEAEDAPMTLMERQMSASADSAHRALDQLKELLGAPAGTHLTGATAALERFESVNGEILMLSRRNSEVRSMALSLGRKRMVTSIADDQLRALQEALATHAFTGTR
jgi:hypothetical protein